VLGGALLFFGLKVGNDASTNGFRGVFYESEGLKKIDSLFNLIAIKTGTYTRRPDFAAV